jgi:hypothetical protein
MAVNFDTQTSKNYRLNFNGVVYPFRGSNENMRVVWGSNPDRGFCLTVVYADLNGQQPYTELVSIQFYSATEYPAGVPTVYHNYILIYKDHLN